MEVIARRRRRRVRLVPSEAARPTGGDCHVDVAAFVCPCPTSKKRSARAHVSRQTSAPAPPLISLDGNCHVRTRLLASLHQPSDSEPEAPGWAKKWDFNFPDFPVCLRAGSGRTRTPPNLCFQTSGERRPLPNMTTHERKSAANTKVMEQCVSRSCRNTSKHPRATKLITFQRADVPQRPNIDRMLNTRSERTRAPSQVSSFESVGRSGRGRTDLCCHDPVMNVGKYLHRQFFWGEKRAN